MTLNLEQPAAERIDIQVHEDGPDITPTPYSRPRSVVSWGEGESGERQLAFPIPDNTDVEGDRDWTGRLLVKIGDGPQEPFMQLPLRLLDNDRDGLAVTRGHWHWQSGLALLYQSDASSRELVLDGNRHYRALIDPQDGCISMPLRAPLRLFGNRATLAAEDDACHLFKVSGEGEVALLDLSMELPAGTPGILGEDPATSLSLRRSHLEGGSEFAIMSDGDLRLERSSVRDLVMERRTGGRVIAVLGSVLADSSSVLGSRCFDDFGLCPLFASPAGPPAGTVSELSSLSIDDSGTSLLVHKRAMIRGSLVQGLSREDSKLSPAPPLCSAEVESGGFNVLRNQCGALQPSDAITRLELGRRMGPDLAYVQPEGIAIDAGGECGPVDQRGAPRPQSLDASTPARCDVGAVELGVNPWRGFWQPERDGHGFDIQTQGNVMFLLWYTYAADGTPTAYQAAAPLTGPRWEAELLLAQRDPASGEIDHRRVGSITIDFDDDVSALASWRFEGEAGAGQGSERISALSFDAAEPRVEFTGTWFDPDDSGWGVSLARRGETVAAALYYYDANGALRWALGNGTGSDVVEIPLDSFTGFCPSCDASAVDVGLQPAGSLRLHMLTPERLRFDLQVRYPAQPGGDWRRAAVDLVPISDPVDNRAAAALIQANR